MKTSFADKFKNLLGIKPKVPTRAEQVRVKVDQMIDFMRLIGQGNRADRHRFRSGVKYASAFSNKKCETPGCANTIGVVTAGQHKRFCSDHNRKGRLERRRAEIARFAHA